MIGIIPAAGAGERIQPLGCSKELLPVGSRIVAGRERPKAVAEYLVERMIAAGVDQICMVISPEKTDLIRYFSECDYAAEIFYVLQKKPLGLCDALFRADPFVGGHEQVLIGLPDTVWFPENAYRPALAALATAEVGLVLFPVPNPQLFDAVTCDEQGYVQQVQVKAKSPESNWVWGAITTTGAAFHSLKLLWESRHRADAYIGHLFNGYLAAGNSIRGLHVGEIYLDVGTLDGYRLAQDYLRKVPKLKAA
jgi:glucose-1-phosphate thymidylyltransferase